MQDYIIQSIQEGIRLKENILNNRQMLTDIETVGNLIVQPFDKGTKSCFAVTAAVQPMPSISLPNSSDVS